MLKIEDINVYYGNIQALRGISMDINKGEIVTLIGANGAGKSTLLKTISGLLKPKQGKILFEGESIGGKAAQKLAPDVVVHKLLPFSRILYSSRMMLELCMRLPARSASTGGETIAPCHITARKTTAQTPGKALRE